MNIDIDVDIRVPAMYLDMVYTTLQQSDMEHEYVTFMMIYLFFKLT